MWTREEKRKLLESTDGKMFSVTFVKKSGEERTLVGRTGVTKHLRGGENTVAHKPEYITVYDMNNASDYRNVNLDTLKKFVFNKSTITF